MFSKLLKYDTRWVFKYWWIAAATSFVLSLLGGVCIGILNVDYTRYRAILAAATVGLALVCIALVVFYVLSQILIFFRFYKHFFTDEGYLTFTLPVKKSSLLNAKILTALIFQICTLAVVAIDVLSMLAVGLPEETFTYNMRKIFEIINELYEITGGYFFVYAAECVLIFLVALLISAVSVFICITVASVITQKHRVLASIGIYYLAAALLSGITQWVMFGGNFYKVFEYLYQLDEKAPFLAAVAVLLLGGTAILVSAAALLYLLQSRLLDRRLNLE